MATASFTVNVIRAEMGQHIGTALARILADELEADWAKVRIDAVDTDPKWGVMMTGGSNSVWATFPIFSRAGAAGRIALIEEGAKLLGVPAQQCLARNGAVVAGNRSVSFGDVVKHGGLRRTFTPDELAQLPIKPASERRLIGRNIDAIDIPAKTNGTARYGIDATIDGMVYARPKIPPTRNGARVRSIDDSAARKVKGYISSLALEDPSNTVPGWVMVFASSYPAAISAADLVKVDWLAGDGAKISERDVLDHGAKQIAEPNGGSLLVDDQGLGAAFLAATLGIGANLYDEQRAPCPARAGQRARVREEWHPRDPYRQSVAEPDPARARQGAPHAAGANRDAHLFNRRRLRP